MLAAGATRLDDSDAVHDAQQGTWCSELPAKGGGSAVPLRPVPCTFPLLPSPCYLAVPGLTAHQRSVCAPCPPDTTQGTVAGPGNEVTHIAWNRKVQHILASTIANGTTVVWDLKRQKPVISFKDPNRQGLSWQGGVGGGRGRQVAQCGCCGTSVN